MSQIHLIRVSLMGHVGRFRSVDATCYPRGVRVICRTSRGLEVGEVLAVVDEGQAESEGQILRAVTTSDDLLLARLEQRKSEALEECQRMLTEQSVAAVLLDAEVLFDGESLYFYFLGNGGARLDALTRELAATYDQQVQFRRFADTLAEGCGPGCGTDEAEGGGCALSGCSTCSVASACGKSQH